MLYQTTIIAAKPLNQKQLISENQTYINTTVSIDHIIILSVYI